MCIEFNTCFEFSLVLIREGGGGNFFEGVARGPKNGDIGKMVDGVSRLVGV